MTTFLSWWVAKQAAYRRLHIRDALEGREQLLALVREAYEAGQKAALAAAPSDAQAVQSDTKPSDDQQLWDLYWELDTASMDQGSTKAYAKEQKAFFDYLDANYVRKEPSAPEAPQQEPNYITTANGRLFGSKPNNEG